MYEWSVEVYDAPLTDPDIWEGRADDYEEAVTDAAEMAEATNPYQTVITITRKGG